MSVRIREEGRRRGEGGSEEERGKVRGGGDVEG